MDGVKHSDCVPVSGPPPDTDVPKRAADEPASSKADLVLSVINQKDCYLDTLLTDKEYLNDVSVGYAPKENLKKPFKFFTAEDRSELFPVVEVQSEKLFAIVQKKSAWLKTRVVAAMETKKGVVKVSNDMKIRAYLCHKNSMELAKQDKSAEMVSAQVDKSEEMVSAPVDKSEEMVSVQVDKSEKMESAQVDKSEEMLSTQVDKPEEMVIMQVDNSEETESMQADKPEEMESKQVDKPEEMVSSDATTDIVLLGFGTWFSAEKLQMLRAVLDAGWKREVVMRSRRSSGRKTGDVYYYSPDGRKFRTSKQVEKYLIESNSPFTIANFTHSKIRISGNPEQEVVRTAYEESPLAGLRNQADSRDKAPSPAKASSSTAASKVMLDRDSKTMQEPPRPKKGRRSIQPPKRYPDDVMLLPKRSQAQEKKFWSENADDKHWMLKGWPFEDEESSSKLNVQSPQQVRKMRSQKQSATPCSIGCPGMKGVVPNLPCARCRCLFHMKCVGIRASITFKNYLCSNCAEQQNVGVGPSSTASRHEPMMVKKGPGKVKRPVPELTPISYEAFVGTAPPAKLASKVDVRSLPQKMIENEARLPPPLKRGRGRPPKIPQEQSLSQLFQFCDYRTMRKLSKKAEPPSAMEGGRSDTGQNFSAVPHRMNPDAFKLAVPSRISGRVNFSFPSTVPPPSENHEPPSSLVKLDPQSACKVGGKKVIVTRKRKPVNTTAEPEVEVVSVSIASEDGSEQVSNSNGGEANDNLVTDDKTMDYGWLF